MKELYSICFHDPNEYVDYFFCNKLSAGNALYIEDSGRLISELFLIPKKIMLKGAEIPCPYVVGACTLPSMRGKGLMNSLILKAFWKLRIDNSPLTALYPFRHSFYIRQGFVTVNRITETPVDFSHSGKGVFSASAKDASGLSLFYNMEMRDKNCYLVRTEESFKEKIAETTAGGGKFFVQKENGKIIGYIAYDEEEIIEFWGDPALPFSIKELDGKMLPAFSENGAEYLMLRITDAEKLLTAINYPPDAKAKITLDITDTFLPENSGRISLIINGGRAEISNKEFTPYALSIEQLTLLVSGAYQREGFIPPEELIKIFPPGEVLIYEKY